MIEVLGCIPARMGSSRFPGKPIELIDGKPMIWHVWQRALLSNACDDYVIATCDKEIKEVAEGFGAKVVMTSTKHTRANDRVAEVSRKVPCKYILNIQGDEPMLDPRLVRDVVKALKKNPKVNCINPVAEILDRKELLSIHNIKVAFDFNGKVVYFSRCPIPSDSVEKRKFPSWRQVPIIGFRSTFCQKLEKMKAGPFELQEGTDLLRAVENDMPIHIIKTKYDTIGVDTPGDRGRVEKLLKADKVYKRYKNK